MSRTATVSRITSETSIELSLNLDGTGTSDIATGLGFFDHMLTLLVGHSLIDLNVRCQGDLHVDGHHTVEDVGRALGQAVREALGERRGIRRYGHSVLPMDECLVTAAVDLGGRAACVLDATYPVATIGTFDTQLVEVFWEGFAATAGANVHAVLHHGRNAHHIAEAIFKGLARSIRMALELDPRQPGIRMALELDPRQPGIPSTKGSLTV